MSRSAARLPRERLVVCGRDRPVLAGRWRASPRRKPRIRSGDRFRPASASCSGAIPGPLTRSPRRVLANSQIRPDWPTKTGWWRSARAPGMPGATAAEVTPDGSDIGVVINSGNLLDGGAVPSGPMPFIPSWTPASPVMPFAGASDQALIASLDLQVPVCAVGGPRNFRDLGAYRPLFRPDRYEDISARWRSECRYFDSRGTSSLDIGIDNGPGGTGALYVVQPAGQPSPYDVVVPGAAHFAGAPWTGERHFALAITPGTLSHLISVVNANAPPGQQFSTNPADYQLSNVSVDAELEYFGQRTASAFPCRISRSPRRRSRSARRRARPSPQAPRHSHRRLSWAGPPAAIRSWLGRVIQRWSDRTTTCSSAAQALPRSSRAAATTRFSAASAVAPSR